MPREQDRIDVVMLTKNSEKPFLDMCLRSIYTNIPVRKLIIIDGKSTDNSRRILSAYPNVSVIEMEGSRGAARERGISEVETDWFAFIDSDVILCKSWHSKIRKHVKVDTGAVWGVAIPSAPRDLKRCLAISRFYRKPLDDTMLIEGNRRGMLHDTLVRTELVKDIRIPTHLHVWEDQYIKHHIVKKGFTWNLSKKAHCHHYADLGARNLKDLVEFGRIARAYGYYSWRRILIFTALGLPKAAWIYSLTGDHEVAKWQLDAYRMIIAGWISDGIEKQIEYAK
jgi:glycosyltransferase involved in cell wall biosynthesis